jgi:hypothetical protein
MAVIRQPTVTSWIRTATGELARIYHRPIENPPLGNLPSGNLPSGNLPSGKSPKVRRPGVKDARGPEAKEGLGEIHKYRRKTAEKRRAPTEAAVAAVETVPPVTTKVEQQHPREAFREP